MKKIIITIDGHSACGKSTLAKALAQELDYGYIDTGAMYRAVTYFFLENRVNIQKTAEIERALTKINITFKNTVAGNRTFLNGRDVEDVIRKMFVSKNVSHVSAISTVRRMVVRQQQEMGRKKGIVMEGRDIGTVVFPKAELKIFLTADEEVRTQRRFDELKKKGHQVSANSIKANLRERDLIDSTRKDSPLKKAKEAVLIDNTNLNQKEQLLMTWALAKERIRQVNIEKTKQKNQKQNQNQKTKSSPKPKQTPAPRNQKTNQNQNQKQNQKTKTNSKTKQTSATRNQKNQNQNQNQKTNQKQNQKTKSNPKTKQTPATRNQKVAQKNQKQKQNQKTKTNSKTKQTSATRNQKVADKNTAQKNQKATAQTSKKTTTSARSKKTAPKNISKKVKPETPKKATPTTRKKATPKTKKKDNK